MSENAVNAETDDAPADAVPGEIDVSAVYEAPQIRALREAWQRGEPLRRAAWACAVDYKIARRLAKSWRARGLTPALPDPMAFAKAPAPRIPELQEARRDGVGVLEPGKAERAERHAPVGPNTTPHGVAERARREALRQRVDRLLAELPRQASDAPSPPSEPAPEPDTGIADTVLADWRLTDTPTP